MKKSCKMEKLLSAFADGELTEKEALFIRQHLAICPECQKEHEAFQSVDRMIAGLEAIEPSEDFARGFWQKVDESRAKQARWSFLSYSRWGLRPSFVAAVMALLIVSGVVLFQKSQNALIDSPGYFSGDSADVPSGMLIAENLELYGNLEVIEHFELFENWDAINKMEDI